MFVIYRNIGHAAGKNLANSKELEGKIKFTNYDPLQFKEF
jgi:hypothetical protein